MHYLISLTLNPCNTISASSTRNFSSRRAIIWQGMVAEVEEGGEGREGYIRNHN
jgi:hypothetical protein